MDNKEKCEIIDSLYQKKWFTSLSKEERVTKLDEIITSNDIKLYKKDEEKWDDERRRDNPHHYNNRLD